MSKDIWHTELNDFKKEQPFCCLFFTKSEPKTLCLGCYNPCTQMFGNYMNHKSYLPNEIDKFANVENLLHENAQLTHKVDVALAGLKYIQQNCLEYAADYMDYADTLIERIKDTK